MCGEWGVCRVCVCVCVECYMCVGGGAFVEWCVCVCVRESLSENMTVGKRTEVDAYYSE